MFTAIVNPDHMRSLVFGILGTAGGSARGTAVKASVAALHTREAYDAPQNARTSGRAESKGDNAVYRAVRSLKGSGLVTSPAPGVWSLTDEGKDQFGRGNWNV